MAVVKWSKVAVDVESTKSATLTITAISQNNPGQVTTQSAHGYSNGDWVVISAAGMTQVDGRVFRISGASASVFNLEGENTTNYDAFTSGSVFKITAWSGMQTATGLTASGGDYEFIDTTTIHSPVRTQIPGLASPATYTFENLWDPADTALLAFKTAADNQSQKVTRFSFAGGQKVVFNGYIGATLLPTGTAQDKVQTSVTITMFGRPTIYAS
jgi:hypothetical protein